MILIAGIIWVFLLYADPLPVILLTIIGFGIWFTYVSILDHKRKAIIAAEYNAKWNPEAVFERRMQKAITYEKYSAWTRNPDVEIGASQVGENTYSGIIKTLTGLQIWRCAHSHSRKQPKTRRYTYKLNASIQAARDCAQKELDRNRSRYLDLAKISSSGNRRRTKMTSDYFEPTYDTLKAFNWHCAYCGKSGLTKESQHKDHVVPLHVGGENSSSNMLPTCNNCNLSKNTKSVFHYLLDLEAKNGDLPYWVVNSPTWNEFRNGNN